MATRNNTILIRSQNYTSALNFNIQRWHQLSLRKTCNGGVLITSRELNQPMRTVRPTTPPAMVKSSIQSNAKVISKKKRVRIYPDASERNIPVREAKRPSQAYS